MIDFHCHILPNLDDGAVTSDDSIAMASALSEFGYKTVCCTPHCIKGYYDLTAQKVREATLMLQADLDNEDISLELLPGMEYMLDEHFDEFADDLLPLGGTRLILCEAPQQAHHEIVQRCLKLIIQQGFVPLIAHPERTQYFYEILSSFRNAERGTNNEEKDWEWGAERRTRSEEKLQKPEGFLKKFWPFASRVSRPTSRLSHAELPEACLLQVNLGSFTGFYGGDVQRRAYELLKQGVYSALASDLHDGSSASKVLVADKIATNPLLQKLSEWDGMVAKAGDAVKGGGQGELF